MRARQAVQLAAAGNSQTALLAWLQQHPAYVAVQQSCRLMHTSLLVSKAFVGFCMHLSPEQCSADAACWHMHVYSTGHSLCSWESSEQGGVFCDCRQHCGCGSCWAPIKKQKMKHLRPKQLRYVQLQCPCWHVFVAWLHTAAEHPLQPDQEAAGRPAGRPAAKAIMCVGAWVLGVSSNLHRKSQLQPTSSP